MGIDLSMAATQTLVLAPTRELACPIQKVELAIGEYLRVTSHACMGGTSISDDSKNLLKNPHFVVGTPGRVRDMISKRVLNLDALKLFVLDEMDELMSRGFKGLIFDTMEILPPDVQLAVFSATMPPDVLEEMKRFLRQPVRILVKKDELTLEGVRQFYVAIEREEYKLDTLVELLEYLPVTQVLVYCNTRRKVDFLAREMDKRNNAVLTMHAELGQEERKLVMSEFEVGGSSRRVLISTDLLARGLDVQVVPLVVNYDLPQNTENYLHRIGRSGRFYRKGVAINFVTSNDGRTLKDIERFYHTQIEEMPVDIGDII